MRPLHSPHDPFPPPLNLDRTDRHYRDRLFTTASQLTPLATHAPDHLLSPGVATTFINKNVDESILLDLKHLLIEAKQRIPPVPATIVTPIAPSFNPNPNPNPNP